MSRILDEFKANITKEQLDKMYEYFKNTKSKEFNSLKISDVVFSRSYAGNLLEANGYEMPHKEQIENNVKTNLNQIENNVKTNLNQCENQSKSITKDIFEKMGNICEENSILKQTTVYLSDDTREAIQNICKKYPVIKNKYIYESLMRIIIEQYEIDMDTK